MWSEGGMRPSVPATLVPRACQEEQPHEQEMEDAYVIEINPTPRRADQRTISVRVDGLDDEPLILLW